MNYQKHYDLLMSSRKEIKRCKNTDGIYYENHHIIPKCVGGSNDPENLVLLTAKEHYIAHHLLFKSAKNKNEIIKFGMAFSYTCYGSRLANRPKITAKQYNDIKNAKGIASSLLNSGQNNPMYGKKHSEESKKKISQTKKDLKCHDGILNGMYGKNHSEEAKQKISQNSKGYIPWCKNILKDDIRMKKLQEKRIETFKNKGGFPIGRNAPNFKIINEELLITLYKEGKSIKEISYLLNEDKRLIKSRINILKNENIIN